MAKALSLDLRIRVPAAVEAGVSYRQAAERFGVRAASVSRWRALTCHKGEPRPGPSAATAAWGASRRRAVSSARSSRGRLTSPSRSYAQPLPDAATLSAMALTRKKDHARQRAGSSGRPEETAGPVRGANRPRSPAIGLHRRDLGQDQHGAQPRALPAWRATAHGRAARPVARDARHGSALRAERTDQPRRLRALCRARPRAGAPPGRHRDHGQSLES